MARYIDADALTSKVRHFFFELIDKVEPIMTEDGGAFDLKIVNPLLEANKAIASIIREQPTADVREVVRCKDCENWDTHWTSSTFRPNAHYCCVLDNAFDGDFFCACGERRKKIEV